MKLNKIVTKNKIEPKDWNKFILKKETDFLLILENILNLKLEHLKDLLIQN